MLREKVQNLDAIVYTHEHKDHTAGMDDVRAFNFKQQKPMDLFVDENVEACLRKEFSYPTVKTIDENLVLRSKWFNGKDWCESYRNMDTDPEPLTKEDWKEIMTNK